METGRALVAKYMADAAPSVQPQAVELPVEGVIAGVRVQGILDLLDTEGRIIDFKTAARRPAGITPDCRLQLTTYSMITPGSSGFCRLDTVTKTKTVQLVQQNWEIGPEKRRYAETLYPMVREAFAMGSTHHVAAARCVLAGIAGTGANASGNSADESTSERLGQICAVPEPGVDLGPS